MAIWDKITSRGRIEDRRGNAPLAIGGISLSGLLLLLAVNFLLGGDPQDVLNSIVQEPANIQQNVDKSQFEGEDDYEVFVSTVLGSNNDMWNGQFSRINRDYTEPKLVLFRTATESACGTASSQVGPHYCPLDQTIYLDETFFDELTNRFGAEGGDVAEAYVIAHEVAHHAQAQLGVLDLVQRNPSNEVSIATELQADCFAGLWANSIRDLGVLGPGEIREAMDAAAAVGDDRIQEKVSGYINPENWTHGSSDQRVEWFNIGYESGDLDACNTFNSI